MLGWISSITRRDASPLLSPTPSYLKIAAVGPKKQNTLTGARITGRQTDRSLSWRCYDCCYKENIGYYNKARVWMDRTS